MRRKILVALMTLGLVASGAVTATASTWTTANQHQIIPLYIYPNWYTTGNTWDQLCSTANATLDGSTFIANPATGSTNGTAADGVSGPGFTRNTDYAQIISDCHHYGQNVIGYVDTNYGKRPLHDVEADVSLWFTLYNSSSGVLNRFSDATWDNTIDGVFLDEVSPLPTGTTNTTDNLTPAAYYRALYLYIVAHAPNSLHDDVLANPGQPPTTDWMLHDTGTVTQIADELIVFEGQVTDSLHPDLTHYVKPSWISSYPASDTDMLVYNVPQTSVASVCSTLKSKNAGNEYITPQGPPTPTWTPWNADPPMTTAYFSAERTSCG